MQQRQHPISDFQSVYDQRRSRHFTNKFRGPAKRKLGKVKGLEIVEKKMMKKTGGEANKLDSMQKGADAIIEKIPNPLFSPLPYSLFSKIENSKPKNQGV